jgi:predicted enzyme related to lactoylglutathione lyase
MPNPVTHFEIVGGDGTKLQDFYGSLFGWQINADNPMNYGIVEPQEGHGIGGGVSAAQPGGSGHVTFYVEVADLQATLDKAVSMGGRVAMPVTEIPGQVTFAQFIDPAGNMIGIAKDMGHA